jgi:gluconokinase
MGVSGSGKSAIGSRMAEAIGADFLEGDDFHPPANKAKMHAGIPLDDDDRWPWLRAIAERVKEVRGRGEAVVVACSALKRSYRDLLRDQSGGPLIIIFLEGDYDLLSPRMKARKGHFMPATLLKSQLDTLEDPSGEPGVITVSVDGTIEAIVAEALSRLPKRSLAER